MKNVAIILSAGSGKRMGADRPKQYLELAGKPIISYAIQTFQDSFIDEIVLVTGEGDEEYCRKKIVEQYHFTKVKKIVAGGKERYHSVYNGILAAGECDYIYIHDGARPMLDQSILQRAKEMVEKAGACIVGMPVKDTMKLVGPKGNVVDTPKRESLYQIQTPQAFAYPIIKRAYDEFFLKEEQLQAKGICITDDAMVVETMTGEPVFVAEGSYYNIKITTPEDLKIAEIFQRLKQANQPCKKKEKN